MSRSLIRLPLCAALVLGAVRPSVAQPPIIEYTVQVGDTCGSIAHRFLGDWRRYQWLIEHNPQLGLDQDISPVACGRNLQPGVMIHVPREPAAATGPDAELTAARRQVRAREPERDDWQSAQEGLDLFRGWRVNTGESSAAEITFRDRSLIQMRQNTLVIIYGGVAQRAEQRRGHAELTSGTLRSRLAELRMQVETPTAVASLNGGSAVVDVRDDATSRVSNHDGEAATVRSAAGGSVAVAPGFGSKVLRGQRPTRPRPLPPAPMWDGETQRRFASVGSNGARVFAAWRPVDVASAYRVEILDAERGYLVAATEVPSRITQFELHRIPPGTYTARVSTIDGDVFESRPSGELQIEVHGVRVEGFDEPVDLLPDPATEPEQPRVIVGTTVSGLSCASGDEPGADPYTVSEAGSVEVRCTDAEGRALAPFVLDAFRPELRILNENGEPVERVSVPRGSQSTIRLTLGELQLAHPLDARVSEGEARLAQSDNGNIVVELSVPADAPDELRLELLRPGTTAVLQAAAIGTYDEPVEVPTPRATAPAPVTPLFGGHELFRLASLPELMPITDEAPRGHRLGLAVSHTGEVPGGDGFWRLAALAEAELVPAVRLGVVVPVDLGSTNPPPHRGDRDVIGSIRIVAMRRERFALSAELAAWFPTGPQSSSVNTTRLMPSLMLGGSFADDLLRLHTRQGASVDLRPGPRLWASGYGADLRVYGPLRAAFEFDLALGRDAAASRGLAHAGIGIGLVADIKWVAVSLGGRYALTRDLRDRQGRLTILLGVHIELD